MWCLSKPVIKKKSNSESEPTTKIQQKKNLYENKCMVCKKNICVCCVYIRAQLIFLCLCLNCTIILKNTPIKWQPCRIVSLIPKQKAGNYDLPIYQ